MNRNDLIIELYGYRNSLLGYLRAKWLNIPHHEDVADELLFSFMEKYLDRYDGRVKLNTYFFNYCFMKLNEGLKEHRMGVRYNMISLDIEKEDNMSLYEIIPDEYESDKWSIVDYRMNRFNKVYEKLSDIHKEWFKIYLLPYSKGVSYKELCEINNETIANIKNRIHLLRKSILKIHNKMYKENIKFDKTFQHEKDYNKSSYKNCKEYGIK